MAVRGAAWRRRQRRLRSMLRHERQTVAMELAAALYHICGGGPGKNEGLQAQMTASAGPAEYFELSSDDGRPAGGERPAVLHEPRPQGDGAALWRWIRACPTTRCSCAADGGTVAEHR